MKEKLLSVALLILVISFVTVNTVVLEKQIKWVTDEVSSLSLDGNDAKANAERIYQDFMKKEKYICMNTRCSLTSLSSHNLLF